MDSISEVKIDFQTLTSTVADPMVDWQLLLRITADFQIVLDEQLFYQ